MKKIYSFIIVLFCSVAITIASPRKPITPETALQAYLHNSDKTFKWEVQDKKHMDGVTIYRVIMTSQQWRTITWKHEMFMIVPDMLKYNDALLFITGGHVENGEPSQHKWDEDLATSLSKVAKINMTIVALLWQVPNQPLYGDRKSVV